MPKKSKSKHPKEGEGGKEPRKKKSKDKKKKEKKEKKPKKSSKVEQKGKTGGFGSRFKKSKSTDKKKKGSSSEEKQSGSSMSNVQSTDTGTGPGGPTENDPAKKVEEGKKPDGPVQPPQGTDTAPGAGTATGTAPPAGAEAGTGTGTGTGAAPAGADAAAGSGTGTGAAPAGADAAAATGTGTGAAPAGNDATATGTGTGQEEAQKKADAAGGEKGPKEGSKKSGKGSKKSGKGSKKSAKGSKKGENEPKEAEEKKKGAEVRKSKSKQGIMKPITDLVQKVKGKTKRDHAKKSAEHASKDEKKTSSKEGIDKPDMLCSHWPRAASKKDVSRIIAVIRSAERVDRVFGADWTRTEAPHGYLTPTDLNVPNNPAARNLIESGVFHDNPPITAFGKCTIQLTARAMANRGVKSKRLICSPTLRCIQTAEALANFLKAKIVIEPGLLEPLAWYRATSQNLPDFHLDLLSKLYPIDTNYTPQYKLDQLLENFDREQEKEGVARINNVLRSLAQESREEPLIFVAHAITLAEAASLATSSSYTDKMEGGELIDRIGLGVRFPPGSLVAIQCKGEGQSSSYDLCPGVVPPLSYGEFYTNQPVFEATA
ncbi:hypothetical protein V3C99_016086 [Haemonchus contortus]